jgi:hypothetical protein
MASHGGVTLHLQFYKVIFGASTDIEYFSTHPQCAAFILIGRKSININN